MMIKNAELQVRLASLAGKCCSFKAVGEYKSLTIGFGDEVSRPTARNPLAVRSEWEIGTYTAAWRIVHGNEVLCGSMDPVDGNDELDLKVQGLQLGAALRIEMVSQFDIRVVLSEQSYVEFICVSSDDDEILHIFGPDNFFSKYSIADGWTVNGG
jgi:hypothetical protein